MPKAIWMDQYWDIDYANLRIIRTSFEFENINSVIIDITISGLLFGGKVPTKWCRLFHLFWKLATIPALTPLAFYFFELIIFCDM